MERWVAVSAERVSLQSRPSVIVGISDITERRQAEETLKMAKHAAEAANRAKSEFLAMISHELRTPINGILGLSQLLEDLPLHERARQLVNRIRQSGAMLAMIIGDILDIATFEVSRLKIHSRPFDLRETVLGPVSVTSAAAAAKGIKVRVSIGDALPPKLVGDPDRLQQIINNLVSNSIKFTAGGEIGVEVRLVGEDAHRVQVEIIVADSGIGIPPEAHDKIFQPFWQGEEGIRRQFGGTGLGLSICKRLVEAMNGSLGFSSELGRGSSFWFQLWFDRAPPEEMPELLKMPKLRILVADDVPLNLEIAAELIRSEGHDVTAVASGKEVVSRALCEPFDLLVIDIRMPDVDGLTAARRIRAGLEKAGRSVPILGLTANLIPTDLPMYRVSGIDEIVEKPIDRARLLVAIHRWAKGGAALASARPAAQTVVPTQRIAEMATKLGPERAARIVELFVATARDAVETVGHRCAALAFEDVAEAAHKLAGAASNVGFADLAEQAGALEHAARKNDARAASELAMRVITLYQQAAAHANEMLATPRPAA